jgi:hypothetical protein
MKENIINDWLLKNQNPEIDKQVEMEAEQIMQNQQLSQTTVSSSFDEGANQYVVLLIEAKSIDECKSLTGHFDDFGTIQNITYHDEGDGLFKLTGDSFFDDEDEIYSFFRTNEELLLEDSFVGVEGHGEFPKNYC